MGDPLFFDRHILKPPRGIIISFRFHSATILHALRAMP